MTRAVLVLACIAVLVLVLFAMRAGWRNRARRQAHLPELLTVPSSLGTPVVPALHGVYVGTSFASSWQDRVVHAGLGAPANASATLHPEGVLIERAGAAPVFVPVVAISGARLAPGLAGRVVGAGGLLVISWTLGEAVLDTGLRADDKSAYPAWVRALTTSALSDGSPRSETSNSPSLNGETRHSTSATPRTSTQTATQTGKGTGSGA